MSFRMPQNLSTQLGVETGQDVLHRELVGEQAAALGRLGRAVEVALESLNSFDAQHSKYDRDQLVSSAANAVWEFFVQRDVMGLRDTEQVIAHYSIPAEVLARIGEKVRTHRHR